MTAKKKLNCWEYWNCGRGPTLSKDRKHVCPSATEYRFHAVHGGRRAGRACWVVAGTMCQGKVQGVFAQKYNNCKECEFYKSVLAEEGAAFELTLSLMQRLGKRNNSK
jgi:hypothetical protein